MSANLHKCSRRQEALNKWFRKWAGKKVATIAGWLVRGRALGCCRIKTPKSSPTPFYQNPNAVPDWTSAFSGHLQRLKLAAQNRLASSLQPAFQDRRVNGTEIGCVFEIALGQVRGRKAWLTAEEATLHFAAHNKHRRGCAMIRTAIGVFGNAPAKFTERH